MKTSRLIRRACLIAGALVLLALGSVTYRGCMLLGSLRNDVVSLQAPIRWTDKDGREHVGNTRADGPVRKVSL